MPDSLTAAKTPSGRDARLDVLRGICLVMIFINHIPGNPFENLTSRNFGFSDAAEGFVLMSGIAAGLAYGLDFRGAGRFVTGLGRIWKRAWTLYQVHVMCSALALAVVAAVALLTGDSRGLMANLMKYVFTKPLQTFIGIPLMTHQFGYMNILPLYTVLLLVSPVLLWLAWRWPVWLVAGSLATWFIAGTYHIDLPNFPLPGGWFFNPFAWQIIFVIGLLTGVFMRQGKRLVPVRRWLQAISWLYLAFSCLTIWVPPVDHAMGHTLWLAKNAGVPWFFTDFDKTYATVPRLLHIMALAYLLSSLKVVRWACATAAMQPFALLGRQALPVFALGSVLCLGLQALRWTTDESLLADCLMVFGGLALQFALAAARTWWPGSVKARTTTLAAA
ncbi:OpgC family protein [Fuscibacter oryzae]|uniref:OpgC domain-containing protein n=1 Tax=Fuscibacter oryzae TaxID=2803939 RepID=A0A8J7MMM8_9RHOB|nr:OpgC domain-containing protein [Fuscibacter oryzae]MBL4927645.1 OpgC domain-containing protein [Fuscibacter oryzae]